MNNTPNQFRIAINMAGAISAGAYTAGVLDFLVEALEQWHLAKDAFRAQIAENSPSVHNAVPLHDVSIEAMTGASAGGMCAAISAAMIQGEFDHIRTGDEQNTNNTFYESWVNEIDIAKMLQDQDLAGGKALVSLLDCTVIDDIADKAISLPKLVARPYVSPQMAVLLTLTNTRGVSYPLYADASGSVEEYFAFYGDKIHFQIQPSGAVLQDPTIKPLPLIDGTSVAWPLLKSAAKATGAFPIFLAPRKITRDLSDYVLPPWKALDDQTNPGHPVADLPGPPETTWDTLIIDGGITDNDPMELANAYLAMKAPNPKPPGASSPTTNPGSPESVECTVISVSPFPPSQRFDPDYFVTRDDHPDPAGIFTMLGNLLPVLLSQSRFLGESLSDLTQATSFNHFAIAPSDTDHKGEALQSSCLGAFGGFLDRRFRKHDFLLGRRNCQKFLKANFLLPTTNPIIHGGLQQAGPWAATVTELAKCPPPDSPGIPLGLTWIPVIPLCGTAFAEVSSPVRETMSDTDVNRIADLAFSRLQSIRKPLLDGAPSILRFLAWSATSGLAGLGIKPTLRNSLKKALKENYSVGK